MQLGEHDTSVVALAWSPDGRALASCGTDGILLIHALNGSYTHRLQLETATSLSWTGSVIAIGRSNSVAVFDITSNDSLPRYG